MTRLDTALAEHNAVQTLPCPTEINVQPLKKWLEQGHCGVDFPPDHEAPYQASDFDDYVTFKDDNPGNDPIVQFLEGPVVDCLERLRRSSNASPPTDHLRRYSHPAMARASNALSAAISSLLPTVCVLVICFVEMIVVRIGLVILFTELFSMALAFLHGCEEA